MPRFTGRDEDDYFEALAERQAGYGDDDQGRLVVEGEDAGYRLSEAERTAIEAARVARTPADWQQLPVVECACGQRFYQEHTGQPTCRDCMGNFWFYPVPAPAAAERVAPTAYQTLERIDRVLCRQLQGQLTVEQALAEVSALVEAWTDPGDARIPVEPNPDLPF